MGTPFGKSSSGTPVHANWEKSGGPKMGEHKGFEASGGPKMPDTTNKGSTHTDSGYKGKGSSSPRNGTPQESYYQTNSGNGNKGAM